MKPHHLPNDVARCSQVNCLLKEDCLRSLAWRDGTGGRVVVTEFPPVKKMDQGCEHQIPVEREGRVCDECRKPAFRVQRDAANHEHVFCEQCWGEHVAFSGNDGKPYGFYK